MNEIKQVEAQFFQSLLADIEILAKEMLMADTMGAIRTLAEIKMRVLKAQDPAWTPSDIKVEESAFE